MNDSGAGGDTYIVDQVNTSYTLHRYIYIFSMQSLSSHHFFFLYILFYFILFYIILYHLSIQKLIMNFVYFM